MKLQFDPIANYQQTLHEVGYVERKNATQELYDQLGFCSGLEVHQQLKTSEKLFCRCPAGILCSDVKYDSEIVRHMRPTLSELGEYDGTALMEFKTRKKIVYRVYNDTTCTYEIDDTPPFPINRDALNIAIRISALCKLNIVGEVHITRKQYLDGSIPAGFQRTAIIGVEGEFFLKNKKIRLIQLSLEEDSCREVSDIGHTRIYKTDRLGTPLIETVTYPDMCSPEEVREACDYIRFLNRSTGQVRTGMGAGRQDVNVSCRGGTRVEIKGVAHTKWIPKLTHNEVFRQWALLKIKDKLLAKVDRPENWQIHSQKIELDRTQEKIYPQPILNAVEKDFSIVAINLPKFRGILSHFTQPGKIFADEISDRLKVIACLEKPYMLHSEELENKISPAWRQYLNAHLDAHEEDAQIVIWGPDQDMKTALETIQERCEMAFRIIPGETRKSFPDGTTIFERVLPGADRMYPDTDSPPIPLEENLIDNLSQDLPSEVVDRYHQMRKWQIPKDSYRYILSKNLFPVMERIIQDLKVHPRLVGILCGHWLKFIEGQYPCSKNFSHENLYQLLQYLMENQLEVELAKSALPILYQHPEIEIDLIMNRVGFKRFTREEIFSQVHSLNKKFEKIKTTKDPKAKTRWIMGQLRTAAIGNIPLSELHAFVVKETEESNNEQ